MKHKSLVSFLAIVTLLSAGYVLLMLASGEKAGYLAQGYMLIPAVSALIARLFFDERRFTDANLRFGRPKQYSLFWVYSLCIVVLWFSVYTVLGAGHWDLTGDSFLQRLAQQFAAEGQNIEDTLPPGMTPKMMLLIFFIGGLTVFNIVPGLITGFGEEFGWRSLLFPRLYVIRPWIAFFVGGLIWYAWHLPLALLVPSQIEPGQQIPNLLILALGAICTFVYLAYVYVSSQSVWVTAFAHIAMNNASASFGYLFILENQFMANVGTTLVMVGVIVFLWKTRRLTVFNSYFEREKRGTKQLTPVAAAPEV